MAKVRVGIAGAAGYTAGELLRILVNHPEVEIVSAQSGSNAGNKVYDVHQDLVGDIDIDFGDTVSHDIDVLFICRGHGLSQKTLDEVSLPSHVKVIDLGNDFRLGNDHGFIYGLPELRKGEIEKADLIANPGCFATAIQLGLLPAVKSGMIESDVHISGVTGSTGAGQKLSSTSHFSWRNNNMSVYKAFTHQHLDEIKQSLLVEDGAFDKRLNFIPYRGNFTRGIIITSYFYTNVKEEELLKTYEDYYRDAAFTHVVKDNPNLKQVVNTNKVLVYPVKVDEDRVMVISVIDNLLKGASGQAVQNMNLMFGLDENCGLNLKGGGF